MPQKVIKYGSGKAVILPKRVASELDLDVGSLVEIEAKGGKAEIVPVDVVPRLSRPDRAFVDKLYAEHKDAFDKLAE